MLCKNCGKELNQDVKICDGCGAEIVSGNNQAKDLSLWQGYLLCWKNYAKFNGRARRKEHWGFFYFNIIVAIVVLLVGYLIGGIIEENKNNDNIIPFLLPFGLIGSIVGGGIAGNMVAGAEGEGGKIAINFYYLYCFIAFIPGFAVCIRRLHDVGKSGWNFLWCFTIIGAIPVLIWLCRDSKSGENKYGANPK